MARKEDEMNLVISQGYVSRIVALCIVLFVFVFVAGYYLGKKSQSEEFSAHMQQNAFADQIHSSLYTLYGSRGGDTEPLLGDMSPNLDLKDTKNGTDELKDAIGHGADQA